MANILSESLVLAQAPVAVCLVDSPPDGLPQHEGTVPAGCVFWQSGTQRAFVTNAPDHRLCAIGMHTHNLQPGPRQASELAVTMNVLAELGYLRPQDIAAVPVLQTRPNHIVYAPLASSPLPPDAVLLFVKSQSALILSEACQQVEGGYPPAMGRPACGAVPHVINTGYAAYSLGCCGARAYLDIFADDIAIYAIPGNRLEAYVDRIQVLSKANQVLGRFHELRRKDVESGRTPTINESLAALG